MSERAWRYVLTGLASPFLVLGLWAAVAARSFARTVADFGPDHPHLVHDFAATSATFGLALVLGAYLSAWRTPALVMAAVWNGLHSLSHLLDVGAATPGWVGPLEAAALLAVTAVLAALARMSSRPTA
jgi:hypothetical protein